MKIQTIKHPDYLNPNWDKLALCYFQKREFLSLLHKYNPCSQRYYELYRNDELVAGTVVYTLNINLLTFSKFSIPIKMQVIGLPASIAAYPVIGNTNEFVGFIDEVINIEHGLILGLNLSSDFYLGKVLNMRTLPTLVLRRKFQNLEDYSQSLRYNYRRRLKHIQNRFKDVDTVVSDCSSFSPDHYELYLQIMQRTKTKLETLNFDLFKNLPNNFSLTTHYQGNTILSWQICCRDTDTLFFFFGGMNYKYRDTFCSYHNNLLSILSESFGNNYSSIDFGQTAERPKASLGAEYDERRFFLYHKNRIIYFILYLFKGLIAYRKKPFIVRVFHSSEQNSEVIKKAEIKEFEQISK